MTVVRCHDPRFLNLSPHLAITKEREKEKVPRRAPAKGRPKAQPSPRTRIGAPGTTINVWLCVWNSMQVRAKEMIAITTMDVHIVFKMDVPVCRTTQRRIIEDDPPEFIITNIAFNSLTTCWDSTHPTTISNLPLKSHYNPNLFRLSVSMSRHSANQQRRQTLLVQAKLSPTAPNSNGESSAPTFTPLLHPNQPRLFLDLFAGHSAPLAVAAPRSFHSIWHWIWPNIQHLDDRLFENLLQLVQSGAVGAIWSAPPCRLYATLRKKDGGPPPLRSRYPTWMVYLALHLNNFNKSKNLKKFIAALLSYAPPFSNKVVLQEKNNPSIP